MVDVPPSRVRNKLDGFLLNSRRKEAVSPPYAKLAVSMRKDDGRWHGMG
jgi:hypothetical protein